MTLSDGRMSQSARELFSHNELGKRRIGKRSPGGDDEATAVAKDERNLSACEQHRTLVDTGRVIDSFGKDPAGYIMYGEDGRMMVLIVRSDRPKPTHEDMTDQQRVDLFRSMAAYAGSYTFDGKRIVHHIDISWNEILTGTDVVREVEVENGGKRLVYRSGPGPSPSDGTISMGKLVWEKVD